MEDIDRAWYWLDPCYADEDDDEEDEDALDRWDYLATKWEDEFDRRKHETN